MLDTDHTLAALLGSRICHDLISPLGAIGNGVELLSMSGSTAGPELSLITESVDNANARIKFFRIAFGAGTTTQIANREVQGIIADYTKTSRVQINWLVAEDPPRNMVKLAFLLIQCAEMAMPFGGKITVLLDGDHWRIEARAEKMKVNAALWEVLSNPAAPYELSPAEVQFALVPHTIKSMGRSLSVEVSEDVGIVAMF